MRDQLFETWHKHWTNNVHSWNVYNPKGSNFYFFLSGIFILDGKGWFVANKTIPPWKWKITENPQKEKQNKRLGENVEAQVLHWLTWQSHDISLAPSCVLDFYTCSVNNLMNINFVYFFPLVKVIYCFILTKGRNILLAFTSLFVHWAYLCVCTSAMKNLHVFTSKH